MRIVLAFLALFVLAGCKSVETTQVTFETASGDVTITAEVVDTQEERARGLMFRESLGQNKGMIFLFEPPGKVSFYMKNTLIPLDIIYVDTDGKVSQIIKADPCTTENCELFPSTEPVSFVVEVNQDFTSKNGIVVGTQVVISK